jgi:hypothetical protein
MKQVLVWAFMGSALGGRTVLDVPCLFLSLSADELLLYLLDVPDLFLSLVLMADFSRL